MNRGWRESFSALGAAIVLGVLICLVVWFIYVQRAEAAESIDCVALHLSNQAYAVCAQLPKCEMTLDDIRVWSADSVTWKETCEYPEAERHHL